MKVERFVELIDSDFYVGVPDSQLKALGNYLMDRYGIDKRHHIIAANEGNCVAIGAGYHLATGRVPVVYMQNSGEGNIVNPVVSLLNDKVYAIPMIFVVGWRGEPGVHDEPQHIYQGEITLKLLEDIGIHYYIIEKETKDEEIASIMVEYRNVLEQGKNVAFVVKKGALEYKSEVKYVNKNIMQREEIIRHILEVSKEDPIVSTTGKASRELFEIRETRGEEHRYDFLTVGSMGHSSSIALGIALNKENKKIWCIDGDGAALMHMGAMALIGYNKPSNFVHILINNASHETVGGLPTVAENIDLVNLARACGYGYVVSVDSFKRLDEELKIVKEKNELCFMEVKCAIGSREDLGRPTTTAIENKINFMKYLMI